MPSTITQPVPDRLTMLLQRLKREQKTLARRQVGSGRWELQRLKVAKLHARVMGVMQADAAKLELCLPSDLHRDNHEPR